MRLGVAALQLPSQSALQGAFESIFWIVYAIFIVCFEALIEFRMEDSLVKSAVLHLPTGGSR